ncbi:hypothetical protein NEIG_00275 [Nematocida sp. ERTm5]|nr:hypothetical protein NEIG_00275 [Nematocida sp. ERTm5]
MKTIIILGSLGVIAALTSEGIDLSLCSDDRKYCFDELHGMIRRVGSDEIAPPFGVYSSTGTSTGNLSMGHVGNPEVLNASLAGHSLKLAPECGVEQGGLSCQILSNKTITPTVAPAVTQVVHATPVVESTPVHTVQAVHAVPATPVVEAQVVHATPVVEAAPVQAVPAVQPVHATPVVEAQIVHAAPVVEAAPVQAVHAVQATPVVEAVPAVQPTTVSTIPSADSTTGDDCNDKTVVTSTPTSVCYSKPKKQFVSVKCCKTVHIPVKSKKRKLPCLCADGTPAEPLLSPASSLSPYTDDVLYEPPKKIAATPVTVTSSPTVAAVPVSVTALPASVTGIPTETENAQIYLNSLLNTQNRLNSRIGRMNTSEHDKLIVEQDKKYIIRAAQQL